jgi:hypothetical protein
VRERAASAGCDDYWTPVLLLRHSVGQEDELTEVSAPHIGLFCEQGYAPRRNESKAKQSGSHGQGQQRNGNITLLLSAV